MGPVKHLYEALQERVNAWRGGHYPCDDYPVIGEILEYALLPESDQPRFLRRPQLRALETYWHLRLIEDSPRIPDLYARCFPKPSERLAALGIPVQDERVSAILIDGGGPEALFQRILTDDAFARDLKLESLRETLTLDYPSYIFALAMGAGKTILIGAIIVYRPRFLGHKFVSCVVRHAATGNRAKLQAARVSAGLRKPVFSTRHSAL